MTAHQSTFPPAHPHGLASRQPDARWPAQLRDLYRIAYTLHGAAQGLWQQAQGAGWRDEERNHAYRTTVAALDEVELLALPLLRAWEHEEHWR